MAVSVISRGNAIPFSKQLTISASGNIDVSFADVVPNGKHIVGVVAMYGGYPLPYIYNNTILTAYIRRGDNCLTLSNTAGSWGSRIFEGVLYID